MGALNLGEKIVSDKILVLGATGTIGRPLVQALLAKGEKVKAASRSGQAVKGAEGVAFNYSDPSTFASAFEDVDRAFIMLPSGIVSVTERLLPVVQAASVAGVKIVLLSVMGAEVDDHIPYRQVELAVERSGVRYVILRPNWFSDNFHTFWKAGVDHGRLAIPAGDGKTSFIDVRDIAASAAAALTSSNFDGKAFTLTGPEALTYAEAAAILSDMLDRTITYAPISSEEFVAVLTTGGAPAEYAEFLAAILAPVSEGRMALVTNDVERFTGTAAISLEVYAGNNKAALTSSGAS